MIKIAAERLHAGGLVMQLVLLAPDVFYVERIASDDAPFLSPTIHGPLDSAKQYVDDTVQTARHNCLELGCPPWTDLDD